MNDHSLKLKIELESKFADELYQLLCQYRNGEIKGNGSSIGYLSQPLTQLYDEIIATHQRIYHKEPKEKANAKF